MELIPCPFCGKSFFTGVCKRGYLSIVCLSCHAVGPGIRQGSPGSPQELWNQRTLPDNSKDKKAPNNEEGVCPYCLSADHLTTQKTLELRHICKKCGWYGDALKKLVEDYHQDGPGPDVPTPAGPISS